jgi:hypothetical protein
MPPADAHEGTRHAQSVAAGLMAAALFLALVAWVIIWDLSWRRHGG